MSIVCKGTFSYFREQSGIKNFSFETLEGDSTINTRLSQLEADNTVGMITLQITKKEVADPET